MSSSTNLLDWLISISLVYLRWIHTGLNYHVNTNHDNSTAFNYSDPPEHIFQLGGVMQLDINSATHQIYNKSGSDLISLGRWTLTRYLGGGARWCFAWLQIVAYAYLLRQLIHNKNNTSPPGRTTNTYEIYSLVILVMSTKPGSR